MCATGIRKRIGGDLYLLVPKESGYSYVICFAFSLVLIVCYAPVNSFGLLYSCFLDEKTGGISGLTLVSGVSAITVSLTGIFVNVALKRYSLREIGTVGAVCLTLGWFANVFVQDARQLLASTFVQSAGLGVLTSVSFTAFNQHFVRKRVTWMSCCQMMKNIGGMLFPLFVEWSLGAYGTRGTFLIMSALAAHAFFGVLCMHPIEWYADKTLLCRGIKPGEDREVVIVDETISVSANRSAIVVSARKSIQKIHIHGAKEKTIWSQFAKLLDLSLFEDKTFVNVLIGVSTTIFSDTSFITLYPLYLYSLGFDRPSVAICVSVLGGSDMLSRASLAIFSKFYQLRSRSIFYFGMVAVTISRIVFLWCSSFWSFVIITSILGYLRGLFLCGSLIFSEDYHDKFTAAFGMSLLFTGVMSTVFLPLLGLIRDYLENYLVVYIILIVIPCGPIISWTLEFWNIYMSKKGYVAI